MRIGGGGRRWRWRSTQGWRDRLVPVVRVRGLKLRGRWQRGKRGRREEARLREEGKVSLRNWSLFLPEITGKLTNVLSFPVGDLREEEAGAVVAKGEEKLDHPQGKEEEEGKTGVMGAGAEGDLEGKFKRVDFHFHCFSISLFNARFPSGAEGPSTSQNVGKSAGAVEGPTTPTADEDATVREKRKLSSEEEGESDAEPGRKKVKTSLPPPPEVLELKRGDIAW